MLFSTFEFLLGFLPTTLAGYLLLLRLNRVTLAKLWLVGASLFFYAYWDWRYLPLLIASIVVNFHLGKALNHQAPRHPLRLLWAGILLNLGVLAYFKYVGFFVLDIPLLLRLYGDPSAVVLPLAISFYTFQQIAYLVDCYRGGAREYSFLNYGLFILFFPQLLMGPIVHHRDLVPQFSQLRFRLDTEVIATGIFFFGIGLLKKLVFADPLSSFAQHRAELLAVVHQPGMIETWQLALANYIRFYFDVSAYADMAIGVGLLFGIRLPLNFNSPLKARNLVEFWSRWHITLTRFLGDHIYQPIVRHPRWRRRLGRKIIPVAILATFLASGLWHGASWNYVVWGLVHGLGVAVVWMMGRRNWRLPGLLAWALTFLTVLSTRTLANTDSLAEAAEQLMNLVAVHAIAPRPLWGPQELVPLLLLPAALLVAWLCPNSQALAARAVQRPWIGALLGVSTFALLVLTNTSREFAYFEF